MRTEELAILRMGSTKTRLCFAASIGHHVVPKRDGGFTLNMMPTKFPHRSTQSESATIPTP